MFQKVIQWISILETGDIVEGDDGNIRSSQYLITLRRNANPDLCKFGHYWEIKEMVQTGTFKQLI